MDTNSRAVRDNRVPPWAYLLLAATALLIFFFRLGGRGFENKDTIWYVEISWEMLRSANWLVPRFNTVIFTEKPILFIWLVAAFSWLAGAVTPLTARLPSALAALGGTLLTAALGRKMLGARAGLLAGFILCTNYAFAWEARTCMVDMLFTFFVTLSLYFFYAGLSSGGKRQLTHAYVAMALAALTKGPLGVILPAIVVCAYLLMERRLGELRRMLLPRGALIVIAVQAAWYIPFLISVGPEGRKFFYEMYIYKENLLRFTSGFDHYEPFWFYVPALMSRFLPWSPFLVVYCFLPRPPGRDRRFPAAWFLGIFVFLTISSGKHSRYALPLYPAAALLVADLWDRFMDDGKWRAAFIAIVAAFAVGWSCYMMILPARDAKRAEHRRLAEELSPAVGGRQLATYGIFSRRLALGFFMGRPVIYIDRESGLVDYLNANETVYCLLEPAEYERLRGKLPATVAPSGNYRYRDNEFILIRNR